MWSPKCNNSFRQHNASATAGDKPRRVAFTEEMLLRSEADGTCQLKVLFTHEGTSHVSGKVNLSSVRIWDSENPRRAIQHTRESPTSTCGEDWCYVIGPVSFLKCVGQGNVPGNAVAVSSMSFVRSPAHGELPSWRCPATLNVEFFIRSQCR
jgi:hypothetical protein